MFVAILLHHSFVLPSQSDILGNYLITNFNSEEFQIGTENWDSKILENGHILFANNSGVLDFDGVHFETYPLPNKSIVRSICVTYLGRIFAGGQDEIGFFAPNEKGKLEFTSIRSSIPSVFLPLEDIWQMVTLDDKLYFRSVNRIYIYDLQSKKCEVIDPKKTVNSLVNINNQIYYQAEGLGFVSLADNSKLLGESSIFKDEIVINIHEKSNASIIVTEENGVFRHQEGETIELNQELSSYLKKNKVFVSIDLPDNKMAIGTQFDGILIIDDLGNIYAHSDKSIGLINNNVRSLSFDPNGNLWAGTYNGISKLELQSQLREIQPDQEESSCFYDAMKLEGKLYFASQNGLFYDDRSGESFGSHEHKYEYILQSQGQVWGIDTIDGQLLMAHDKGPYTIVNNKAVPISKRRGVWKFLATGKKNSMYVGTYNGIDIYKKEGETWKFFKKLEGFNESSRILISVKDNEIWVSHPYRGIYKITHNENFEEVKLSRYGKAEGLPSDLQNYVFNIDETPYVTGEIGVYKYDSINDIFINAESFDKYLDPKINTKRLFQDQSGRTWFISEQEVGYLEKKNEDNYLKNSFPELVGKFVGGFEQISFIDKHSAFICTNKNILILDHSLDSKDLKPQLNINKVELSSQHDSLLYGGYVVKNDRVLSQQGKDQIPNLHYKQNALTFHYSSIEHSEFLKYGFRLVRDQELEDWSDWSSSISKEYNNLSHGNYVFEVKARSKENIESEIKSFVFEIRPPWFLSIWAKALYLIMLLSALTSIVLIPNKKYKKETEKLADEKRKSEEDLARIRYEKLQADIDYKNAELASATMHLVQKNETLSKIKQELDNVQSRSQNPETRKQLRKVISLLNDDTRLENEWENFAFHFDQVHTNFLKKLSEKHQNLTSKDLKLCAYLKMNLTTKEIAPLLNISVRGTEISRYRLRKKLELPSDQNLNEYMMKF